MDPLSRISIHRKEFTDTENKIAKTICEDPSDVIRDTIVTVANNMNVSKSALLRFCQKIGYEGFSEFKYEMTRFMNASEDENEFESGYIEWIQESLNYMNSKSFIQSIQKVAELIVSSKEIRIFGINETGLSARQLYYRLLSLGIESFTVTESEVMHYYYNTGDSNDLHIFFSMSAMTESVMDTLAKSLDKKKKTILITQNSKCKYNDKVDGKIILPTINTKGKRRFTDPQMLNFIFIELLINTISNILIKNKERSFI